MQPEHIPNKILESFFDSAPMMMGVVELRGNDILHISDNKATANFFKQDQLSLRGKLASELGMPKKIVDEWVSHYKRSRETSKPVRFEYVHEAPPENRCFSITVCFIGLTDSGRPYFSYMVQDVTEDKKNRDRIQRQEKFLEAVLDNIPDMIFVKEASELRFVRFNKAGEELLGYDREDLLGKNDYDFFPKKEADHFTSQDKKVFEQKKMLDIPVENILTKNKGHRLLHTKKIPLLDENGRPQYLIGISEDITEKVQAEKDKQEMFKEQIARQEVEKSLQVREEFISVASHELKSPISALKLQAEMIKKNIVNKRPDAFAPEKINKLIDLTEREVTRLDRLVNDMLDASRISTGNFTMQFKVIDICSLVQEVVIKMKNNFVQADIPEPILNCSPKEVFGKWDSVRMEQVITNLLSNAIHYGNGKQIEVNVSLKKDNVLIAVSDQGIGISDENIAKIFNRFERAIPRNEVSGLGLGLFISKKIVEAHRGKIWAESVLGKGSTFFVELPLNGIHNGHVKSSP